MVNKKKSGKSGKPTKKKLYNHADLWEALMYTQDTMERCLMPFVLLDETADQVVHEKELCLPEISIGVQKKHVTEDGKKMLKTLVPDLVDAGVSMGLKHKDIPITIWVIQRNYKFFQYPDMRFYNITHFFVPNPFQSYWRARYLIK